MKICLDAFNLALEKGTGIATYTRNLSEAVTTLGMEAQLLYGPKQGPQRDALLSEIALFDSPPPPSSFQRARSIVRDASSLTAPLGRLAKTIATTGELLASRPASGASSRNLVWASRDLFYSANKAFSAIGRFTPVRFAAAGGMAPDVMHWTSPLPLRAPDKPNLYTLHDLVPLRLPWATLDNKRRYLALCQEICSTADQIVTVSENSKADIVRMLGVDEARVTVTYQCVNVPAPLRAVDDTTVAREIEGVFGLGWGDYFLFFGAVEPKKNLARVIEAYLASGVPTPLVIVGGKGWLDEAETRMLYPDLVRMSRVEDQTIRRADRVRRYEYLPFELLVSLIRGAKATLAPYLYEGFGLPVLESMQLGTPVLASTGGSLPEIAGDAAVLVDPYSTHAIRRAIQSLDADADLRDELRRRGRAQAEKFSASAYAARLADLYKPFAA
jgi:glycosyltransferase involved in cell wall biosynthesis